MFSKDESTKDEIASDEIVSEKTQASETETKASVKSNSGLANTDKNFGEIVNVNVKFSVRAKIGGEWFDIKKGKQKVPQEVKAVLLERGALEAL